MAPSIDYVNALLNWNFDTLNGNLYLNARLSVLRASRPSAGRLEPLKQARRLRKVVGFERVADRPRDHVVGRPHGDALPVNLHDLIAHLIFGHRLPRKGGETAAEMPQPPRSQRQIAAKE